MPLTQTSTSIVRYCSCLPPSSPFYRPPASILATSFSSGFSQFRTPASIRRALLGFWRLPFFIRAYPIDLESMMDNRDTKPNNLKERWSKPIKEQWSAKSGGTISIQLSGPEQESSEGSKEVDQCGQLSSVLEASPIEDVSSGSDCFEGVSTRHLVYCTENSLAGGRCSDLHHCYIYFGEKSGGREHSCFRRWLNIYDRDIFYAGRVTEDDLHLELLYIHCQQC